jgi:hypothetical protein
MGDSQQRDLNQMAFRRMKEDLAQRYPQGRWVAFSEGKVVADADDFDQLCERLHRMGIEPPQALVVQAGVDYPESATILFPRPF